MLLALVAAAAGAFERFDDEGQPRRKNLNGLALVATIVVRCCCCRGSCMCSFRECVDGVMRD
jgi:hypothetical protein